MSSLPPRPDLAQLRRRARELQRAAIGGDAAAVARLARCGATPTLAGAQLVVARELGFGGWPSLRTAVDAARRAGVRPLLHGKHAEPAVSQPEEMMARAMSCGWRPGAIPVGAVFTAARFITAHLEADPARYRRSETLTPTNGSVFLTVGDRPVAVACLGLGAPAAVVVLEHLSALGVGRFVAVGPAPAIAGGLSPGDCVVIDRALRDDGVSQHYLEPARHAVADMALTGRLTAAAAAHGLAPRTGTAWTVPTPHRTTEAELAAYRAEGVLVTELTTAALFAVAAAHGVQAASAVVVSRRLAPQDDPAPPATSRRGCALVLLAAAVDSLQEMAS